MDTTINQQKNKHKQSKKTPSFIDYLTIDEETLRCNDKVETISLVHGTGHILVITKSGKQFRTKLSDLISELKTDQNKNIINQDMTLFENILIFRYSANPDDPSKIDRSAEFDKIIQQAKLKILGPDQPDIMKSTNCVEVKVQIDNQKQNDLSQVQIIQLFPSNPYQSQQTKDKKG